MIKIDNSYIKIDTLNTTYLMKINPLNMIEHLYYGKKIKDQKSYPFLTESTLYGGGTMTVNGDYKIYEDCASLEYSNVKRGDSRESFIDLAFKNNDHELCLKYDSSYFVNDFKVPGLPSSYDKEETLAVLLKDEQRKIEVVLYYSTFKDSDMIVRSCSIKNHSESIVRINRLMSFSFDTLEKNYDVVSLNGAWGKERQIKVSPLNNNVTKIASNYGFSSAQSNPFVLLKEHHATTDSGEVFGFNLIYSGNHMTTFEKSSYHKIRIMNGINDYSFSWDLKPDEEFFTPESTLCFSCQGTNGITLNYHQFIKNHILRGKFKNKVRPIIINNWEGTGFDFNEDKIMGIVSVAASLGMEMFVLDDGWFGQRNDDTTSLGDWYVNKNKLVNGIDGLCQKVHDFNMQFGLWIEPEMISPKSDLFKAHPDWAICHPNYEPLLSRNQLVLDLTNDEVVSYLSQLFIDIIKNNHIDYIKWDCNRDINDYYSSHLNNQEEFLHRYILGLYRLMDHIVSACPDVLFESCASGGNRVDMGLLYYMPQFWCSDNTDSFARSKIQEGTLLCYPPCTIGSHISQLRNQYTFRETTYDNKFNVAAFGAFGYELDLTKLNEEEQQIIKDQVAWYKENRALMQYGDFYLLNKTFDEENLHWMVVSKDHKKAIYYYQIGVFEGYLNPTILKPTGLDNDLNYEVKTRKQYQNPKLNKGLYCEEECWKIDGQSFMNAGVRLGYEWLSGNGKQRRIIEDFSSRLYTIISK